MVYEVGLWGVMSCILLEMYRRFVEACCLQLQGRAISRTGDQVKVGEYGEDTAVGTLRPNVSVPKMWENILSKTSHKTSWFGNYKVEDRKVHYCRPQAKASITGQVCRFSFAQQQCYPTSPAGRPEGIRSEKISQVLLEGRVSYLVSAVFTFQLHVWTQRQQPYTVLTSPLKFLQTHSSR